MAVAIAAMYRRVRTVVPLLLVLFVSIVCPPPGGHAKGLKYNTFLFLPHVYAPCGVSGNVTVVGAQGSLSEYAGDDAAAQPLPVSGVVTVYDDCYFAITDLQL